MNKQQLAIPNQPGIDFSDLSRRIKRQTVGWQSVSIDPRSENTIQTLNPKVRETFRNLYRVLQAYYQDWNYTARGSLIVRFISGNRTYAEQDALYAKGRTTAGDRVTNARGGYSNHNFGLAVDIGFFEGNGQYMETSGAYTTIGEHVRQYFPQLEWGGDWTTFKDEPHVQWRTGLTMSQMRDRVARGQDII